MKEKEIKTNAIRYMTQKNLSFSVHQLDTPEAISGVEVAKLLQVPCDIVFKTLVTIGKSGTHYVFMIPAEKELDLRKASLAVGEKNVEMIKSKDLLPLTGYVHGGCSPVGMKKLLPTVVEKSAENLEKFFFSGGKIGVQIETTPNELKKIIPFSYADLTK